MMMHGVASFLIATAAALSPNSAIVVGGSSGMGKAAATQFVKAGGRALLVSRSADKLHRAREEILHATGADASAVDTAAVDAADEAAVAAFAAELASGAYDALVVSAAGRAPHGPVAELDGHVVRLVDRREQRDGVLGGRCLLDRHLRQALPLNKQELRQLAEAGHLAPHLIIQVLLTLSPPRESKYPAQAGRNRGEPVREVFELRWPELGQELSDGAAGRRRCRGGLG